MSQTHDKVDIRNILLLVTSTLIILAVVEIGVRVSGFELELPPRHRYHPDFGWTTRADSGNTDFINYFGFRHRPIDVNKPSDVRRLLILGDSFAFGGAVKYSETFPGLLETWLNENRAPHRWEVLNLAVGGWGNGQQLIALQEHGLAYQPDVVVLQIFPFNDLCNNSMALANTCSTRDLYRPYFKIESGGPRRTDLSTWRSSLRKASQLFQLIENRLVGLQMSRDMDLSDQKARNHFFKTNAQRIGINVQGALASLIIETEQPPSVRDAWEVTEAIFADIQDSLETREIPLIGLVIPYTRTIEPYWESYSKGKPANLTSDYGTMKTEQILASLHVPTISARSRILASGRPPGSFFLMPKDSHLNRYGHNRVAAWISDELRRAGIAEINPLITADKSSQGGKLLDFLEERNNTIAGVSKINRGRDNGLLNRFGLGPETVITFESGAPEVYELRFEIHNIYPGQEVSVEINGQRRLEIKDLDRRGKKVPGTLRFQAISGQNEIVFSYKLWNSAENPLTPRDKRALAINFLKLEIERALAPI